MLSKPLYDNPRLQGSLTIKDQKLEMRVRVAGSSEAAGKIGDMKQLSGNCFLLP